MANASNFTRGFTPASNPERGNNIWATKWAFIYVKRAWAPALYLAMLDYRNTPTQDADANPAQYGAPFSHLFTELKISPIEVHISMARRFHIYSLN